MMLARKMEQPQEDGGRVRSRKRPLRELVERLSIRLRNSEYLPTKEDREAVTKCENEILMNSLKYPLFFGVIAGSVSYRLQVLARGFSIAVASVLGLEFGRQKAEYACMKHLISLEGSPIQSILVDILQKDFPDHPLLREVALIHSARFEGDESSEHKFLSEGKERGFPVESRGLHTLVDSPPEYGTEDREAQLGEPRGRSTNVVNRREINIGRRQAPGARVSDTSEAPGVPTDILVDPFSLAVWTDVDDNSSAAKDIQVTSRREVRRSRMTSEQKREHNRMLREQREGAAQATKWSVETETGTAVKVRIQVVAGEQG